MVITDQEFDSIVWTIADIPKKFTRCILTNCYIYAPNRTLELEDCEISRCSFQFVDLKCINRVDIDNCVLNDVIIKDDTTACVTMTSVDMIDCDVRVNLHEPEPINYRFSR